jgi:hypothetical protein
MIALLPSSCLWLYALSSSRASVVSSPTLAAQATTCITSSEPIIAVGIVFGEYPVEFAPKIGQ